MIEKIPHTIGNLIFPLKCGFSIGYGIGRKYLPIWVLVLVSDLNQISGFGRTYTTLLSLCCHMKWQFDRIFFIDIFSFLDEAGNLCQDKLETIQDTEYETMIQCRVAMKKTCSNQKNSADNNANQQQTQPNEACHTVYDKNCKTVYRPHRSKVRKNLCPKIMKNNK